MESGMTCPIASKKVKEQSKQNKNNAGAMDRMDASKGTPATRRILSMYWKGKQQWTVVGEQLITANLL